MFVLAHTPSAVDDAFDASIVDKLPFDELAEDVELK